MPVHITIDHDLCMGAGECLDAAPATFAFNDKRQAVVKDAAGDARAAILDAAARCPNFAITVTEDT